MSMIRYRPRAPKLLGFSTLVLSCWCCRQRGEECGCNRRFLCGRRLKCVQHCGCRDCLSCGTHDRLTYPHVGYKD